MMVKTVLVFLAVMALVAMVGKALFPGAARRLLQRRTAVPPPVCRDCGRYVIGKGGCDCKGKGKG